MILNQNAEPIEIATVLAALVWVALVTALTASWLQTWPRAAATDRPEALLGLVAIRIIAHVGSLFVALIVLGAGVLQATSPAPPIPSPWRQVFQWGWFVVAGSQIMTLGVIEILTRRMFRALERREAGS